jgi:outer membrane protein assembly factor BamB
VLWTFDGNGPFEASPVLADGSLYVTGRDRFFYAIDARSGRLRYRVCLGIFGDTSSSPAVMGGMAIVGTNRGELLGLDTGLGRILWRKDLGSPVVADIVVDRAAARVYVNRADGVVLAIDPESGDELWSRDTRAAASAAPALASSLVLVGSYDMRRLLALDAEKGDDLWDFSVDGAVSGSPAVEGDLVCFGSDDENVYGLDWRTQKAVGPFRSGGMVLAKPAIWERTVLFGSVGGTFHCYPAVRNPRPSWERALGSPVMAAPAVSEERVYVGTVGGELFCMDRRTGETIWIFETGGKIVSEPCVTAEAIYLTSMDGRIYAIRP